ncbi:MAG: hypothetical protein V4628_01850 [Pseudomonadota bacterium]
MKLPTAKAILITPLLSLMIAAAASSFAAAPDTSPAPTLQGDRAGTTFPERAITPAQEATRDNNREAQGRVESQRPRDTANLPGIHECENSHAPTGAPGLAENDSAQGANPEASVNAQGSRAEDHQNESASEHSNAQIAQAGADCLEVDRSNNENARGQGTGTTPNSQGTENRQTRTPQD